MTALLKAEPICRTPHRNARRRRVARVLWPASVVAALTISGGHVIARDGPQGEAAAVAAAPKTVAADLQRSIDAAIDRAVAYLEASQSASGRWGTGWVRGAPFDVAMTALCGLALRSAGVDPRGPHLERARAYVVAGLRSRWDKPSGMPVIEFYSAGLSEALLLELGVGAADPVARGTAALLAGGWTGNGFWGYMLDPRHLAAHRAARAAGAAKPWEDLANNANTSTTLYAVLGLHAARRHGIEVDDRGASALVGALRRKQYSDGGWCYHGSMPLYPDGDARNPEPYFGATANALAAYLLAGDTARMWCSAAEARRDPTVVRALAWLERHYTVAGWRTGTNDPLTRETTYNLYSVERVGVLLGIERLGQHAWYEEGARHLVAVQRRDGSWPPAARQIEPSFNDDTRTALALLFLARAGRPVASTPAGGEATTSSGTDADPHRTTDATDVPEGAAALTGTDWTDIYHAAMNRIAGMHPGPERERAIAGLVRLGPRTARRLVRDLDDGREERRRSAHLALATLTGEDLPFDADGRPARRSAQAAHWREWLELAEPFLVAAGGRFEVRRTTGPR